MIFMIPLIFGAIAVGTAAYGAVTGTTGVINMNEANEKAKRAEKRYDKAKKNLKSRWNQVNSSARDYGTFQFDILQNTVGRFVQFIESTGRQAGLTEKYLLDDLEVTVEQLQQFKEVSLQAEDFFGGGVSASIGAAAGYGGATAIAGSIGAASTGTAISSLSGAAATNAMLAWFGGGSLAAGGGGMALGSMILGGVTMGPAIALGGFILGAKGEEALTKARKYEADANKAIADFKTAQKFAGQVEQRISELKRLLEQLNKKAIIGLEELESKPFVRERDIELFQQVAILVKAIADITQTSILNSEGHLTRDSVTIQEKYRQYTEETV